MSAPVLAPYALAPTGRAIAATDAEHVEAITSIACTICGAPAGVECTYGASAGAPAGVRWPGKAHLRRLRAYLWGR